MRYGQVLAIQIFAFAAVLSLGGCTKYVPKSAKAPVTATFSRVAMLDSIPEVVPGGIVLSLQFQQITADATRRTISASSLSDRVVQYSLDGGVSYVDIGPLGVYQPDFEWAVPAVDSTAAVVRLILQSKRGIEVLIQSAVFEIRSTGPVLSQTRFPYHHYSNTDEVVYGGGCESPFPVTVTRQDTTPTVLGTAPCTDNRWEFTVSSVVDGVIGYRFSAIDGVDHTAHVNSVWTRDTVAPQITPDSYRLASGAATVTTNYVPASFDASDAATNVTHFCFAYAFISTDVSAPDAPVDGCWIAVNDPDQPTAQLPAKTLALRNFLYRLGYVRGTYGVSAWVRDAAGNLSNRVAANLFFEPGIPPTVINVLASKTDPAALPFSASDLNIPQGSSVIIRWKVASAPNGLNASPVSLYYTQDDITFTPLASGIADTAHGGCGLSSGLFTGCYVWNSTVPGDSYFRVRVAIEDKNGMVASSSTNPLNGAGLSLIAGNTDAGVGASAQAAIFLSPRFGYVWPDSGSLVVSNRGYIFFRDYQKGILWVQPSDGIVRVLMPTKAAVSNAYEGPLNASASVKNPLRIALDYQNGLLVWDFDRIRRIDLDAMTVTTLIGGGSSSADNVAPRQVQFQARGGALSPTQLLPQLIPLPNGNVLFESENFYSNTSRLRVFSRYNDRVTSIQISGTGHAPVAAETDHATEDLTACSTDVNGVDTPCGRSGFVVEYNTVTSTLQTLHAGLGHRVTGNTYFATANLVPSGASAGLSITPHPPAMGTTNSRTVGRNGLIYGIDRYAGNISRFDKASNAWVKMIGGTIPGTCVDGTPALSCNIQPSDAYVDAQSNLFFLDRGQVRTVDGAGKVVTVYGQSHYFGDGGLAQSARFNELPTLNQANDGEVVVLDTAESRLRAFIPGGNISTLAGDGTVATKPNYTSPAASQPFTVSSAGAENGVFAIDPVSKDVFSTAGLTVIRLNRTTGIWQPVVTVPSGYVPNLLGFDGESVLVHSNRYNSPTQSFYDALLRHATVATGVLSAYGGVAGPISNSWCPDGTLLTDCALAQSHGMGVGNATWDAPRQRWLVAMRNTVNIKALGRGAGATLTTLRNVTKNLNSFAYANDAGGERIYYCATDGFVYQRDLVTNVETALPWRIPSARCRGLSMIYRSNRLIFPMEQTGLYGVAEFVLP